MSIVKSILKVILPDSIFRIRIKFKVLLQYWAISIIYRRKIREVRNKKIINVVFFALFDSIWKVDYLYKMLEADEHFNVSIIVCPIVNYGKDNMLERMEACYYRLSNLGYKVIKSYDSITGKYINVTKEFSPDLIFYTNPYKGLIDDRYYIDNFKGVLACYIPYFYNESNDPIFINQPLHNLCWKSFVESDFHLEFCRKHMLNNARNVWVSGYPGVDAFLDSNYLPKDNWKISDRLIKRIIWAPHHTIYDSDIICYSCFLKYADFMLDLAQKYENNIQIAFKPHPILKNKLYELWGREKTDLYYQEWDNHKNTFFVDGDYVDLFLNSDAMIHDSSSFLIEYLYINKPVLRTYNHSDNQNRDFNDFALECLEHYYEAMNKDDVESFVINLISGKDVLKERRTKFYDTVLCNNGSRLPSEKIYDFLRETLVRS